MADESKKASSDESESDESDGEEEEFLPGFASYQDYSKHLLSLVVKATKECHSLPAADEDYEYYASYPSFNEFTAKMGQRITKSIARITKYHHITGPWPSGGLQLGSSGASQDHGDLFEAVVEANDTLLEQVDNLLDEATGVKKAGQALSGTLDSKKVEQSLQRGHVQKLSYIHSSNMMRPQLKWADKIDNSNAPFRPIIQHKPNALKPLPSIDVQDGATISSFISAVRDQVTSSKSYGHPYCYELEQFEPTTKQLKLNDPQHPGALDDVPLTMVTTVEQLQEMSKVLTGVTEIAIDLEHHSYRSFLGLVCLMQLSTRNHDYIVDVLELREHVHILNESFTNPCIVKVLHGADWDILWLQRDLGLYVVNMFDTHQASRMLQLPKNSLAFLLKYCCDVDADKSYQLADWRIRPLPEEMIHYAREDTHYLLYIYDRMRNELIRRGNNDGNLLRTVINRSTEICLKEYEKPKFCEETTHLQFYHKHKRRKPFNSQQIHCLKLLCKWRDTVARREDESYGFTLPNHMMFQIAEILPREPQGILACCNPTPTLVKQYINDVHRLVLESRQQPLVKNPHIPSVEVPSLAVTPKKITRSQAVPIPATPINKPTPQGPPVSIATALNNALSGSIGFECVYYEALKRRLGEIESGFLRANKEVAVVNKVVISPAIKKSMNWSVNLNSLNDHVTEQTGGSPTADDDITQEDIPTTDEDVTQASGTVKQKKRKKKNQSLREMELSQQKKDNPQSEGSTTAAGPPAKKSRYNNATSSDTFTPHDYNQTSFSDITGSHDPPAVPFTPYSTQSHKKQQQKGRIPFSQTKQKTGNKSFTYKSASRQFKKPQR